MPILLNHQTHPVKPTGYVVPKEAAELVPVQDAELTHLLDALTGIPTAMPVATGLHHEHPAGPAWTLAADPGPPRWLHELHSDHGPDNTATNPHRYTDPDDA